MGNLVVLAVLAVLVMLAARAATGHMKGQGGCCGGGGDVIAETHKTLEHPVLGQKLLHIEGMTCDRCKARVERAINQIEGAACEVNLRKKQAVVRYDRPLNDNVLRLTVTQLDYTVTGIEDVQESPPR